MKLEDIKIGEVYIGRWEDLEEEVTVTEIRPRSSFPVVVRFGKGNGTVLLPEELFPLGGIPFRSIR